MPGLEVTAGYSRRVHQGHPMHTLGALSHITMPFIPTFAHVTSARLKGRHHHPHSAGVNPKAEGKPLPLLVRKQRQTVLPGLQASNPDFSGWRLLQSAEEPLSCR